MDALLAGLVLLGFFEFLGFVLAAAPVLAGGGCHAIRRRIASRPVHNGLENYEFVSRRQV